MTTHRAIGSFAKFNSATKYPSILTYHTMIERGRLSDTVQVPFADDDDIIVTEKIDGVNSRIILLDNNDFILGSREELLHASGDRIFNKSEGIVEAVKDIAVDMSEFDFSFAVIFGEVFGGRTPKSSEYTSTRANGFRVFDIMYFTDTSFFWNILMNWDIANIAHWRDHGGQTYATEEILQFEAKEGCLKTVGLTPRLGTIKGKDLPTSHDGVLSWLNEISPESACTMDLDARGRSEGVVIKTPDRKRIAKIRYEDYFKTLGKK
jgi:hypothetical protein